MFWQALPAIASIASGFLGGKKKMKYPAEYLDLLRYQADLARQASQWGQYYYPQMRNITDILSPLIQQRLQQPGLPKELENQVWQLAKQRLASGYGDVERQLGNILAGAGTMRSGTGMQSWLEKIGLPRAQGIQQLGTERAMANYDAMQRAIQEAMGMVSGAPQASFGGVPSLVEEKPGIDWGDIGTLFGKIPSLFGTKSSPTAIPYGATSYGGGSWGMSTPYISNWK